LILAPDSESGFVVPVVAVIRRATAMCMLVSTESMFSFDADLTHRVSPTDRHKKSPGVSRGFLKIARILERLNLVGLQALGALGHDEANALTFLQGLETITHNRAEMHEKVFTIGAADEAETLGVVEPLDGAGLTIGHVTYS